MAELPEKLRPPQDLLTSKQIDKLDLEIESLRKRTRWETFLQFIPLATATVLVLGFCFSVYQFYQGQEKERISREVDQRNRVETRILSDAEGILDKTQTLSKASFLFADLGRALESQVGDKQSGEFQVYRGPFTESLAALVADDLDFEKNPRDVRFARLALDHWPDYSTYLKDHLKRLDRILDAYVSALRHLRDANPDFVKDIEYDASTHQYVTFPKTAEQKAKDKQLTQYFSDIVDGFKRCLALIPQEKPEGTVIKDKNVINFEGALCRPEFSKQILGDSKNAPCQP